MNKAQELLLECFEAKFNMEIQDQLRNMDDKFLARLVGISPSDVSDFRKGLKKFLDERTQFQTLKKALMSYLPYWLKEHPRDPQRAAA